MMRAPSQDTNTLLQSVCKPNKEEKVHTVDLSCFEYHQMTTFISCSQISGDKKYTFCSASRA